jgi:hypothetical protein
LAIKTLDPDPDGHSALYAKSGSGINESGSETLQTWIWTWIHGLNLIQIQYGFETLVLHEVPGIRIPYLNMPENFTFVVRDSAGGGGNLLPVHEDS